MLWNPTTWVASGIIAARLPPHAICRPRIIMFITLGFSRRESKRAVSSMPRRSSLVDWRSAIDWLSWIQS